jgi:hypothetical protein
MWFRLFRGLPLSPLAVVMEIDSSSVPLRWVSARFCRFCSIPALRLPSRFTRSLSGMAYLALTGDLRRSLAIAIAAMLIEAAPMKDFDNIVLPVSVGALATVLF